MPERLRILHLVSTTRPRGAEIFTSDLVRALSDADLEQRVAVLHPDGHGVGFDAPTELVGSGKGRLPGVRVDLAAIRGLRTLVRGWRPHVVQASGGDPLKHAVPAIGRRASLVYRRIGSAEGRRFHGLRRASYGWLMRRAARIVAVAEALRRETLETFRLPPERIVVIPKGIDPDRIRPERGRDATRRAFGIESDSPVILSLGALTWEKDVAGHVEILASVRRHVPEARHLIVGDGPERPLVERAVRERGLTDAALILGARLDVGDLLAASDVLLLASRSEGMPGCLIEAGMVGLPVAGYAMGGVGEVVVDGETGRLTPPGDRQGLAGVVAELLGNDGLRRSMGEAAKERCLRLFSMETVARSYMELYDDLTGRT